MIRMIDIANAAGVSRATVSFVLNNAPQAKLIREEVREKVVKISKELGYRPNQIARSMITGKTKVIGLVSDLPQAEFTALMLSGILTATEEHDYFIKFIHKRKDESALVNKIIEQRLDGVIISHYPSLELESFIKELCCHKIPMAVLANSFPTKQGIRIVSDDIRGGILAVKYLAENGHKNIAFIGPYAHNFSLLQRRKGYKEGMDKYLSEHQSQNIFSTDNSLEEITEILRSNSKITAYFCPWPHLAVNIVKAARRLGMKVPQDISVIAYSNSELTKHFDPAITTIDQHHVKMGYEAASRLIMAIESSDQSIFEVVSSESLPVSLVKGESVAKLN